MSYTSGSHTVFHHRYHIVWITKYRYKVLEGALRERIRTIIRQLCKELGVQIVSGVLSREHVHMFVESRRILRSATSRGASRDAHRIRCRWSSPTCASATGAAFLGSRLLLHHQRQHQGRCHTSVSSEARSYRRQPVVIQSAFA
jgi:REP element-mobilizing transposase RayT